MHIEVGKKYSQREGIDRSNTSHPELFSFISEVITYLFLIDNFLT